MNQLHEQGVRTVLLTGDNQGSGAAVGQALGITDVRCEVLPQDKASILAELKAGGTTVAMVGDGINDAPALAAADVGIAAMALSSVSVVSNALLLRRWRPARR